MKVKLFTPGAVAPTKGRAGDAGLDLYVPREYDTVYRIESGDSVLIDIGVGFEIPEGYYGQIAGRSSMNIEGYFCAPGIIDSGYRGAVKIFLRNESRQTKVINAGMRIAQLIVLKHHTPNKVTAVNELSETERGIGGFGSTGV